MNQTILIKTPVGSGTETRLREECLEKNMPFLEFQATQLEVHRDLPTIVGKAGDESPHGVLVISDFDRLLKQGNGRPGDLLDDIGKLVERIPLVNDFTQKTVTLPEYWTIFLLGHDFPTEHAWLTSHREYILTPH